MMHDANKSGQLTELNKVIFNFKDETNYKYCSLRLIIVAAVSTF